MTRWTLSAVGVLVAGYGGWLLVSRSETSDLVDVAIWLASGVLLHDVVLTGLILAVTAGGVRMLPAPARAPAAVGLVLLGTVTLMAVPVLGGFGTQEDNPTHLNRSYWAGWALLAGLTLLAVVTASLARARARSKMDSGVAAAAPSGTAAAVTTAQPGPSNSGEDHNFRRGMRARAGTLDEED
jgi:hypothetical protein